MRARGWVGIGLVGLIVAPFALLGAEAQAARERDYIQPDEAPVVAGDFGAVDGRPVTLAILGDSTGAGLGVTDVTQTVGGLLAHGLTSNGYRVHLVGLAVSGARVADLAPQVAALKARELHGRVVVAMLIGVNDATHLTALSRVREGLGSSLQAVTATGARVVLGTAPDLGAARNFAQPLRAVAAWRGRAIQRTEDVAAAGVEGVDTVDLDRLGPAFRKDPSLLSRDLFHPSAAGYAMWAEAMLPAVLQAAQ